MEEQEECSDCKIIIAKKEMYCEKCLQQQMKKEEEEVKQLENEINELQIQLKQVRDEMYKMETNQIEKKNDKIELDKKNLDKEIYQLEQDEQQQKKELIKLKNSILEQEHNEDNLWEHINKFTRKLYSLFESNQIADNKLSQLNNELDRLSKLDVLNDLFKISVQDEVATINGLQIGKKGEQPVDWDDISAGVGHLTLLLVYLMKKFMYTYQKIESIELNGSFSKIKIKDEYQNTLCTKTLNLYLNNKTSQKDEEEFSDAFLQLYFEFQQFCKYLQDGDILRKRKINLNLPFTMNGMSVDNKILSLKQPAAQKWQEWTNSVKKFLANVKALIVANAQFDLSL
ncbi:unnamed protein product (macronuclear) [Paramecium tetraurelia]|uniref:Atg6 BARA domain-containing protein n=1 Tax=Paramecium tetraurelia TaxID=5888 RepID=A0DRK9_PARTE|nr:uncharacterized protein GSPATT00019394001 [Paramecium tetraurelia]CAK85676.1 unnamed protein product [Paramecium tetraurelia]|eukprot:XP_001453073.1 hypothetical protein (macronuclear) [Paramecium tetraurelia strain d4-2]